MSATQVLFSCLPPLLLLLLLAVAHLPPEVIANGAPCPPTVNVAASPNPCVLQPANPCGTGQVQSGGSTVVNVFTGGSYGQTVAGCGNAAQTPGSSVQPSPCPNTPIQPSPYPTAPIQPSPCPTAPIQPSPCPNTPIQPSPCPNTPVQPSPCPNTPVQPSPCPNTPIQPSPYPTAPIQPSPCPNTPVYPYPNTPVQPSPCPNTPVQPMPSPPAVPPTDPPPIYTQPTHAPPTNPPPTYAPTPTYPPPTYPTPVPTTTPPPAPIMQCPPGTILVKGVCRLVYCGTGRYVNGRCMQTRCTPGYVWTGLRCERPKITELGPVHLETTVHSKATGQLVTNNVNNVNVDAPISIPGPDYDEHDYDVVEEEVPAPPRPAPGPCCNVIAPRICSAPAMGGMGGYKCASRSQQQCGSFCQANKMVLAPAQLTSWTSNNNQMLAMPPNWGQGQGQAACQATGSCQQTPNYYDCSGCGLGDVSTCSTYCYNYRCSGHGCAFYDQAQYCDQYPGQIGCRQEDGWFQ